MEAQKPIKKYFILQPLLLASMVVLGILLGKRMEDSSTPPTKAKLQNNNTLEKSNNAVEEASRFIEARFLDSVDISRLNDLAIKNMVKELDPYSSYLPADKIVEIPFTNFQDAYGFNVVQINNQWIVDKITPDSEAWFSKLEMGDQLLKLKDTFINASALTRWTDPSVSGHFKSAGDFYTLEFQRRDLAKKKSVVGVYALTENIGYVKIGRFGDDVYDEFITAIDSLYTKKSIKDFVLDLRDNAGGYIEECIRVLNQFFSEKNIDLAYTEGRTVRKIEYKTDGRQLFNLGKLVVLINNGTASAGEVFAGAIQDLERGKIIGQHSYGKGLVQEQYMLSNGAALRLSVSRFYLPSGRSVNKTGIENSNQKKYYSKNKKLLHSGNFIYPDIYLNTSGEQSIETKDFSIKSAILLYKQKKGVIGKDPLKAVYNSILATRKRWSAVEKKKLMEDITMVWGTTLKDSKSVLNYQILIQPEIQAAIKALR